MAQTKPSVYFFCGIGGSGMMPLAKIMKARGCVVHGSDRAYDKGSSPDKFESLKEQGMILHSQDGSGVTADIDCLVTSTAIEPTIPDVKAALDNGINIQSRAELLAGLFNDANTGISIAGTSGKSTVTGMVATILQECGFNPTVMNGGVMRGACPQQGADDVFVTETDESDGSIALYQPSIAVVNNIALDHMAMDQLTALFADFIGKATQGVVLNGDDERLREMADQAKAPVIFFSLSDADNVRYHSQSVDFTWRGYDVHLNVAGGHNVANALAALGVAQHMSIEPSQATKALSQFHGIARRLERVGEKAGIAVIDDFAHNPDKIAASLKALKHFNGRLLVMFQPHGFAPLRLMGDEIIESFAAHLSPEDQLLMPEVYYAGGTVDRSVTSKDIIAKAKTYGLNAHWFETRTEIMPYLLKEARKGDRIIVMGARDDTLTDFAQSILAQL